MKRQRVIFRGCLVLAVLAFYPLDALGDGILNPSMEGNFIDNVAEYWTQWGSLSGIFCQGSNAHDGISSQGIGWGNQGGMSFGPDGIYQTISSLEPGRIYRLSVWFNYSFWPQGSWGDSSITYSIGIDPLGGSNPEVVTNWTSVSDYASGWNEGYWRNIVTFFSASDSESTIFIEVAGYGYAEDNYDPWMGPMPAWWDATCLIDDVTIEAVEIGDGSSVEATSPVPANGANYSEVTITVLNANGEPISGIPVSEITVNCTGSGNTIIGPNAPTDANGQITAKIKSTAAETKIVSVTVLGTVLSDTATIEFGESYAGPIWYVDVLNDGYANGSLEYPFKTISNAIVPAQDGDTIIVSPGTYYENVNFSGKAITLCSTNPDDWAVVKETIINANNSGSVITFKGSESYETVLSGFTITNGKSSSGGGIYCPDYAYPTITNNIIMGNTSINGGGGILGGRPRLHNNIITNNQAGYGAGICSSSGKITHCLIANNSSSAGYGVGLYSCNGVISNCTIAYNSTNGYGCLSYCNGTIKNCIIWGNTAANGVQLYSCSGPTYSCIQNWTGSGIGNNSDDPLFADPATNDFHLRSQAGRWDPLTSNWVIDDNTSPCIDGGDPLSKIDIELNPNGGRINMGFYGGTSEASKSTSGIVQTVCVEKPAGDLDGDCKVDILDFALFAHSWLDCTLDPPSACWQ